MRDANLHRSVNFSPHTIFTEREEKGRGGEQWCIPIKKENTELWIQKACERHISEHMEL